MTRNVDLVSVPRSVHVLLLFFILACQPTLWAAPQLADGHDFVFGQCYAHFNGTELELGNAHVRRTWRIEQGRLYANSLFDQDSKTEWISVPSPLPSPAPDMFADITAVKLRGGGGVFGVTEENSLRIELETTSTGKVVDYEFQIFPEATGIRIWLVVEGNPASLTTDDPPQHRFQDQPIEDALEHLQVAEPHLLLTQVVLHDRTDQYNELASESQWLLHPNEAHLALSGNLFYVENTLTGNGLAFLKEAPLPAMRPISPTYDVSVSGTHMIAREKASTQGPMYYNISFYGNGFTGNGVGDPWVLLAYHGGRNGRIAVLHDYQRQIRRYVPGRDGLLMSNTWGDRSTGLNLDANFVRKEIDAGKSLGVDVVEIDAGWQEGKFSSAGQPTEIREGYWTASPRFWDVNLSRFPKGMASLADYSHARNVKLGLWFSPDSASDFTQWRLDADALLRKERQDGIDAFKLDMLNIQSRQGEENFRALLRKLLTASDGKLLLDLDITAETRLGYFGDIASGPLFIENRYTDSHRYWPHQTLRNFWSLAQYVDPVRLRMEFLNSERNEGLYANDPLAPEQYDPACLFAITMFGSPLGWFENSGLSPHYIASAAPLIARWKEERSSIQQGTILPIGNKPDGMSWTGFASIAESRHSGYLLLFRELSQDSIWMAPGSLFSTGQYQIKTLGGEGTVEQTSSGFRVTIPRKLGFIWVKVEPIG